MILEKHFQFHPDIGLKCLNKDDVARYIEDKIIEYRKFENFNSRDGRYSLLNEILNMYEEDIQNVHIDTTPIHHIKYYDKFNTNTVLQYYDLIWILGSIIYNVFDYEDNKLIHIENGIRGPILMGDMFAKGYKELTEIKNNNINVAYSPILIFVTLLESELKSKFKDSFIQKTILKIEEKANQGTIVISNDENNLIHYLKHDQYSYPCPQNLRIPCPIENIVSRNDLYAGIAQNHPCEYYKSLNIHSNILRKMRLVLS